MKKLNKIFSMVLAILIVFSSLTLYVSASDVTLTVVSDKTDVKAGDTVTIDINLSENSNLNCLTFDVVYDSNKLEYASHTAYNICGEAIVNSSYADGKFRFTCARADAVTEGGNVLSIQFTVKSSSCNTVTLDVSECLDGKFKEIITTVFPVTIHSYGEWVTVTEPACEALGEKVKSCSCGNEVAESIDKLGHDYATDYTIDVTPDCTNKGSKSQHCSRCDSKQNVTVVPEKGHSFGDWVTVVNPSCTTKGQEERICSACGEKETQAVKELGHSNEKIPEVLPDCTHAGLTEGVKCSVCGDILTEQTVVPEKGHDYAEAITKVPTHTEDGEKTFTCNNCGHTYKEKIEANGDHQYIPAVTKEPTCTEKGVMTHTCACGDYYTKEITELGHTSADAVEENYVAPNCTDMGSKQLVIYCSVCDEELSRKDEKISALGHTDEEIPAVAPNCTETGLTAGVKCSVCGDILTAQTVVPEKGHSYNDVVTEPNCTDKGFTTYTCSVCNDSYVDSYVDALGHEYDNGKCTECGAKDPDYYVFSISEPSLTSIRNKDGIILHISVEGNQPEGSYVKWTASNNNFKLTELNGSDSLKVVAENNGKTTFTATLYDADDNVLATDTVELNSKSGFFDKIGGFFRSLFGMTKLYQE